MGGGGGDFIWSRVYVHAVNMNVTFKCSVFFSEYILYRLIFSGRIK